MVSGQSMQRLRLRQLHTPGGLAEVWLAVSDGRVGIHSSYPSGSGGTFWDRCTADNCLGEALIDGRCLAHSSIEDARAYVKERALSSAPVSLNGTETTEALLGAVFAVESSVDKVITHSVSLMGAVIRTPISCTNLTLRGFLNLHGAELLSSLTFRGCRFEDDVSATHAHFNGGAPSWNECTFARDARFSYALATRVSVGLESCTFAEAFNADGLAGALILRRSTFARALMIANASDGSLELGGASMRGPVSLAGSEWQSLGAREATFERAHQIGPLKANHVYCERAVFGARVSVELDCEDLRLDGAHFQMGGSVSLAAGRVSLRQVSAARQLRVSGLVSNSERPQITSMIGADAGMLSLGHVSLERCHFFGANSLHALALEPTVVFASAPPIFRAQRRCIADEVLWRQQRNALGSEAWRKLDARKAEEGWKEAVPVVPQPAHIAALYRELRRGLENRADQPGAADFYFGEMEMRRHDLSAPRLDRMVVALYWMTSGYGLRALRSLLMLMLVAAMSIAALHEWGFVPPAPTWHEALLFGLRAIVPGVRRSAAELTTTGDAIEITLNVVGPVLVGLLLLALRGRVKR